MTRKRYYNILSLQDHKITISQLLHVVYYVNFILEKLQKQKKNIIKKKVLTLHLRLYKHKRMRTRTVLGLFNISYTIEVKYSFYMVIYNYVNDVYTILNHNFVH